MNLNSDNDPIVIGLCGKAGTGKTSVANSIVPSHSLRFDKSNAIVWDHLFFAMPLYEMASIKRMTRGEKMDDRILFQLHEVLFELFGSSPLYGAPPYDDFVSLVKEVHDLSMPANDDIKPREFLQKAGEICRSYNENCFTQWAKRKVYQKSLSILGDRDEEHEHIDQYACIFSDVRYENEAEMIKSLPGGILIRFDASHEIRMDRLFNRDGYRMPDEQLNHSSEQVELIPDEMIDYIIDTDTMDVQKQSEETIKFITKEISRAYA